VGPNQKQIVPFNKALVEVREIKVE
jgi:hypothetical protein